MSSNTNTIITNVFVTNMVDKTVLDAEHVPLLLLNQFGNLTNTGAGRNIDEAMGSPSCPATQQKVVSGSSKGELDLKEQPPFGRPVDEECFAELVQEYPRRSIDELAFELVCRQTSIAGYLRGPGKTWRYGAWIPHDVSGLQLQVRRDACMNILSFRQQFSGLQNLVTDEQCSIRSLGAGTCSHQRYYLHANGLRPSSSLRKQDLSFSGQFAFTRYDSLKTPLFRMVCSDPTTMHWT